jgi:hypothetical protein
MPGVASGAGEEAVDGHGVDHAQQNVTSLLQVNYLIDGRYKFRISSDIETCL